MKTAISIPDRLFEEADRLARELGISRSHLYARAIARFVEEHRREEITEKLNQVYSDEPSELDPVLAAIQWASLEESDW